MSTTIDTASAYVILVNDDNSMTVTQKRRIMQRSKLVDNMWFLANPVYNNVEMSAFSVLLEYVLPVSRKYCSEILVLSDETYNGYIKYTLPFDTSLTSEAGDIELQLTFAKADIDADGRAIQLVRKVSSAKVTITPISAWSDIIPDSALGAIDQRLIKADAQIKALDEITSVISESKADNLRYNDANGELQLVAGNKAIGNKVVIVSCDGSDDNNDDQHEDCVAVVEF